MDKSKKSKEPGCSKQTCTCSQKEEKNKSGTANGEDKKNEIVISVGNDSSVQIHVHVYANAEKCDSKVSEATEEQLENRQPKVRVFSNTFKKLGLKENKENVQPPRDNNDRVVPVTPQTNNDVVNYKKKSYTEFLNLMKRVGNGNIEYTRVVETDRDLFSMPQQYSLAHCIPEDLNMDSGISLQLSEQFKRYGELCNQRQKLGGLAILHFPPRFIYYLIVQKGSFHKPTFHDMWNSLIKLQKHVQENNVKLVAMPRIGCGFNGLRWTDVKFMIDQIFKDTDVTITVCNFSQIGYRFPTCNITRKWRFTIVPYPTIEIEPYAMIVYFGTENGFVSSGMKELDAKFGFLTDYLSGPRTLGQIVLTEVFNKRYLIIGFIVQKSTKDILDFTSVEKCAQRVNTINNKLGKQGYQNLAIDKFKDAPDDERQFNKLRDVLIYTLPDVNVYVCNPRNLNFLWS